MGWLRVLLWPTIIASSAFQIAKHFVREASNDTLWDLHVYVYALDAPNPYDVNRDLLFVYAPMVGDVFRMARSHLFEFLLFAYVLAIVWFVTEFSRLQLRRPGVVFLVALSTGGMGTVSMMSGNVTAFMHLAVLAVLLRTQRTASSTWPFLVLVGLFAIVKPYFVLFAPIALLLSTDRLRECLRIAGIALAVGAIYALYLIWRPEEMRAFVAALDMQLVRRGDYGSSVFAALVGPLGIPGATVGFVAFLGVLIAIAVSVWRARSATPRASVIAVLMAYALLCFVNPRAHLYDLFPAFLCLLMVVDLIGWTPPFPAIVLAASLVGAVPAVIAEFARDPTRAAPWLLDYRLIQLTAIGLVLSAITIYLPMQKRSKM
jgi:hypothetical protein